MLAGIRAGIEIKIARSLISTVASPGCTILKETHRIVAAYGTSGSTVGVSLRASR